MIVILLTAAFQQVPAHQEIGSGHFQLVSLFLVQLMRDLVRELSSFVYTKDIFLQIDSENK